MIAWDRCLRSLFANGAHRALFGAGGGFLDSDGGWRCRRGISILPILAAGRNAREVTARVRVRIARHLFRRAGGDHAAAAITAFGTEVDHPIGGFYDVEIMLDDEKRSAGIEKFAENHKQLLDIVEMQTGGGLVENIEHALVRLARKMRGEFQTLRFAAG